MPRRPPPPRRLPPYPHLLSCTSPLPPLLPTVFTHVASRSSLLCSDSKLTRILEDSLGGNCKTTFMAMVSPAVEAFAGGCDSAGWLRLGCAAVLELGLPTYLRPLLCHVVPPLRPPPSRRVSVHPQVRQPSQVHAQPAQGGGLRERRLLRQQPIQRPPIAHPPSHPCLLLLHLPVTRPTRHNHTLTHHPSNCSLFID